MSDHDADPRKRRPAEPAGAPPRPDARPARPRQMPGEVDGPKGPEPTRYGDWEKGGRASDF